MPVAAIAVGFETGFSGLVGLMQAQANKKIARPEGLKPLRAFGWNAYATAKFTPHTASWTAAASASSVFGLTVISPWTKHVISGFTPSATLQNLGSVLATSMLVSLVTTPINTIGGRYLAAVKIAQTGSSLDLTPTQSLYQTFSGLLKSGSKDALKNLFRPYKTTVALTFLAYGSIEIVNSAVERTLPDYTVTVSRPFPQSSCAFATPEKTQSPESGPPVSAAR